MSATPNLVVVIRLCECPKILSAGKQSGIKGFFLCKGLERLVTACWQQPQSLALVHTPVSFSVQPRTAFRGSMERDTKIKKAPKPVSTVRALLYAENIGYTES